MDVYDEGGALIEEWDEARGRLDFRERAVVHRYAVESAEEGHLETVAEYPETGGRDVAWVVDEPEVGAWHTYDAGTDEEIEACRVENQDFDAAIDKFGPKKRAELSSYGSEA